MKGKKIVLGVTGGIAAYKAAELAREFIRRGAAVHVIMTRNATEFITPLTFQT
ncbi:MAG TPA: flavoprotein, partial [Syntrophales bacterium]|nr:flavoprotein [Syntrophales bacterium]HOT49274.1 flavoprotein [Syntrophales bacterium]